MDLEPKVEAAGPAVHVSDCPPGCLCPATQSSQCLRRFPTANLPQYSQKLADCWQRARAPSPLGRMGCVLGASMTAVSTSPEPVTASLDAARARAQEAALTEC